VSLEEEALAQYVLLDVRMPPTEDFDKDIEWICRCFGFLESRDKEKTAARIFKALLEAMKEKKGLTSDELARLLGLTRGTMVHHLNKFIQSGLVIHREGTYELRSMSLRRTVQEIKRDVDSVFENIEYIAKSIDEKLGLAYR